MVNVIPSAESQSSVLQLQNVVAEAQQKMSAASQLSLRSFYPGELSPDQERMVETLGQFFSGNEQVFLLKGFAGTGKTFLLGGILRYLSALKWHSCCCAPTGKATQVLIDKLGVEAFTIHKTIYEFAVTSNWTHHDVKKDGLNRDEEIDTIVIGTIANINSSCLVMLVDESSMVSDTLMENDDYICGSGKLLSDIFTFLRLEQFPGRKVIFIGDAAQLPPVGSKISPALNAQYIKEHFGYTVLEDELRSIVRQQAQSAILQNSMKLRQGLQNNFYQELAFTLKPGEFDTASSHESLVQELAHRYKEELLQQRMPQLTMICSSNQLTLGYNLHIRHYLFNLPYYPSNSSLQGVYAGSYDEMQFIEHPLDLQCGDLLLILRNNYLEKLYNGQLVILGHFDPSVLISRTIHMRPSKAKQRMSDMPVNDNNWIQVTLKFLPVELWCWSPNNQWVIKKVMLLTNALYSPERTISRDEQRALYVDFIKRHRGLKRGSKEFIQTLISDPYYNAIQVHFGYALTCHKSQGSEWQHVYVDCNGSTGANEQNFRWLYTAITRAQSQLTLINYSERKVASNLKIASTFKFDTTALPSITSNSPSNSADTTQAPSLNILREPNWEQSVPSLGAQQETDWDQTASNIVSHITSSLAELHEPNREQSVPPFAQSPDQSWDPSAPPFVDSYDPRWAHSTARLNAQPDPSPRSNVVPTESYFYQDDAAIAPINMVKDVAQPMQGAASAPPAQRNDTVKAPAEQLVSFCAEQCRQLSYAHLQVSHLASLDYQEQLSILDERESKSMILQVYYGGNDCYSRVRVSKCNLDQQFSNNLVNVLQASLKGRSRFKLTSDNTVLSSQAAPPDMQNIGFNSYLQRLQEQLAQNHIWTLSWQQLQYVLRIKFQAIANITPNIHNGDSVELDIVYNGKYKITNIKPSHKGESDKPLGLLVINIIHSI